MWIEGFALKEVALIVILYLNGVPTYLFRENYILCKINIFIVKLLCLPVSVISFLIQ